MTALSQRMPGPARLRCHPGQSWRCLQRWKLCLRTRGGRLRTQDRSCPRNWALPPPGQWCDRLMAEFETRRKRKHRDRVFKIQPLDSFIWN